ncbi:uncharacterized protein KY384_008662 [Bacidia gigantensis]|uniref:uncharacterized protein n=1 Tax=Bacidia gigantensis TaxID=2732470 RepID=UPI001D047175|nr:uncharacterized protein KY384_008662 [Bacidia gigantensis]KAG8527232.1 hypothetical protein KY384_008662 [Bacidia gigantensis]
MKFFSHTSQLLFSIFWLAILVLSIEPGDLGVKWNVDLATGPTDRPRRWHVWTAILEFDDLVSKLFTNGEIAGIARMGYKAMENNYATKPWNDPNLPAKVDGPNNVPVMVAVITFGKRVYIASPIKGKNPREPLYNHLDKVLRETLLECQFDLNAEGDHENIGACGELMAAHIAIQSGIDADLKANEDGHRGILIGGKVRHLINDGCEDILPTKFLRTATLVDENPYTVYRLPILTL